MGMDTDKGEFYNQVNTIVKKGEEFLSLLASMGFSPNQNKVLDRLFSGKEAEKMVGKTTKTIAKQLILNNTQPINLFLLQNLFLLTMYVTCFPS